MESKFSHLPDISTIQPDRLIKYRVSEDKFSAEVLLPGLSYTDFDQKIGGKLSLWSLGKVFEAARWQAMIHGFSFYPEIRRENAMFVASQSMSLSKDMHNVRYANFYGKKRPLKAYVYISNVGTKSFTVVVDLYDQTSGLKLGSNVIVAVFVNRKLRKPANLPKELYAVSAVERHLKTIENQTIQRAVLPTIPNGSFQCEILGRHSDSDMNKHITQATYLRWCSDVASTGALKGHLSQFSRHIELYPLKFTEFHYIGEALVNDVVVVNVWEGESTEKTLNFAIQREGKIIFIMKMEFYDLEAATVSPHLRSKL